MIKPKTAAIIRVCPNEVVELPIFLNRSVSKFIPPKIANVMAVKIPRIVIKSG